MENISLNAKLRAQGTGAKIRSSGNIPAVVYGHNIKTESLEVQAIEFERVFRKAGESTIIQLNVDGEKVRNVIIQDAQKHYLNGKVQHIDFYEVSMTEKMTAHVPLEFTGVSKAVKEQAGILVQVLSEVEVECLPADLPHSIIVDISVLNTFSDAVQVRDLKVSDKVTILADVNEMVVKVSPPRDVEKELESQLGDVSAVEGIAPKEGEAEAAAPGAEAAAPEAAADDKGKAKE